MKAQPRIVLCLAVLLAMNGIGCATVVNGTRQKLIVNSNPPGATFEVDGQTGVTPGAVEVSRRAKEHTILFRKPGYQSAQVRIRREFGNPWLVGDPLLRAGMAAVSTATWPVAWAVFPIGVGVDYISGAAFVFPDDNIHVNLQPLASGNPPAPATSEIECRNSNPDFL